MLRSIDILLFVGFCILLVGCTDTKTVDLPTKPIANPTVAPSPSPTPSIQPEASADAMRVDLQLPQIMLASTSALVASPIYPRAYISSDPLPAGTQVHVVGADQNAAWLLVIHGNKLGWIPAVYSRTGVATLDLPVVAETLSGTCATYLGSTSAPEEIWVSTTRGAAIIQSLIFRPRPVTRPEDISLVLEGESGWQTVATEMTQTPITSSGEIIQSTFMVEDLAEGTRLRFQLTGLESEPIWFQAAFYSRNCASVGAAPGMQPTSGVAPLGPTSSPDPISTPIIVRSGPLPDLVFAGFKTKPGKPARGQPYLKLYTITNKGSAPAGKFTVHIDWDDGSTGNFEINSLAAGASKTISKSGQQAISGALARTGKVTVDFYNEIQESNESNNQYEIQYTFTEAIVQPQTAPSQQTVSGPLAVNFHGSDPSCKNAGKYLVVFSVYASGGKPPYTYYHDINRIGGPVYGGITYPLAYREGYPAVGTFYVIDSTGQREEVKFFVHGIKC